MKTKFSPTQIAFSALLMLGVFSACGNSNPSPDPASLLPEQYSISIETSDDSLYRDAKVVVEGYLRLPFSMFVIDRVPLELYSRPNQREGKFLNVELNRVDTNSSGIVKLPSGYTHADLRVVTDAGDTLRGNDRVRLSGRIKWHEPGKDQTWPAVVLEVDSVFPGREKPKAYPALKAMRLDSLALKDLKRTNYLVMAEGTLKAPSMMWGFKENWVFFEGDFGKVAAYFVGGDCAACLGALPEGYTDSDFKVKGSDGQMLDFSKPVRIIGNYSGPDSMTTGDLSVEYIEQIAE